MNEYDVEKIVRQFLKENLMVTISYDECRPGKFHVGLMFKDEKEPFTETPCDP